MLLVRLPVTSRLLVVEFWGESNVILGTPQPLRCSRGNCKQKSVISLALTLISPQGLLSTTSSPVGMVNVLWVNERQLGGKSASHLDFWGDKAHLLTPVPSTP